MKNLNTKFIFSIMAILCAAIFFSQSAIAQQPINKGAVHPKQSSSSAAAKFRVTLNGFAINNQSDDDILEGDGKGDEIYLRADVWDMDKNGTVSSKQPLRSRILGDIGDDFSPHDNPPRLKAGSAGYFGGLHTNDKYPTNQPWQRGAVALAQDRLPMILWEGKLIEGENGVAIVPTVWEWDSLEAGKTEINWDNQLDFLFLKMKPHLLYRIQHNVKTSDFDMQNVINNGKLYLGGIAGTRPIGMERTEAAGFVGAYLRPQVLPLNYNSALKAAMTSPGNSGMGVFAFRYHDLQDNGDYTIYIQVEKIN